MPLLSCGFLFNNFDISKYFWFRSFRPHLWPSLYNRWGFTSLIQVQFLSQLRPFSQYSYIVILARAIRYLHYYDYINPVDHQAYWLFYVLLVYRKIILCFTIWRKKIIYTGHFGNVGTSSVYCVTQDCVTRNVRELFG